MAIYQDNYFTNDSYDIRTARLEILKNYIEYWAAPLAIPRSLVNWGIHAHDKWKNALLIAQSKKDQSESIYQDLRDADEKTFKYYLKCKRLLKSSYPEEKTLLRNFGVAERFPRNRNEKIAKVEKFITAFKQILDSSEPVPIPQNFISKLEKYLIESKQINEEIEKIKTSKSTGSVSNQMEIFKEDSRKLRLLLSWALMTWESDEPYLVQLGFAVKTRKSEEEEESDEEDN